MRVAITGASGFIGSRLAENLCESGNEIVKLGRTGPLDQVFEGIDAVVHLAGEPVAQRWSAEVKQRIRDSRVLGTERLIQGLSITRNRPKAFVCASAVGYYGDRGDEMLTESSNPGTGFLSDVCRQWEEKADLASSLGMRVVKVRIGVVLGPNGGALRKMLPPFKAGLGGRIGSGHQWMPWIHLDDFVAIFRHALDNPVHGVLNGVAPAPSPTPTSPPRWDEPSTAPHSCRCRSLL